MNVKKIALLGFGLGMIFLSSCSSFIPRAEVTQGRSEPQANLEDDFSPRWEVNEDVYQAMTPGEGRIEIDREALRLTLYNSSNQAVITTDCSTGIDGRTTPYGSYRIKEMIIDKRSNKYGKYVSKETGEVVVEKSWEVSGPPPGTKYLGIAMPYWMRLTWSGVGIHVGQFPRGHRTSFGCVRMPEKVQPLIYQKCRVGMLVTIR